MKLLTKSRFKTALSCPTKLYYLDNPEYENQQVDDPFLQALAEGGFQVGELAKCYYPGGHDITDRGYDVPLEKTNKLLEEENVTIYEATIRHENLFIRVDILEKRGNTLNLIEVKAKSYEGGDVEEFFNNKGETIVKGWDEYLQDVAYQKYVTQKAFPNNEVKAFLMLADKSKQTTVDGLNQRFMLTKDKQGRTKVEVKGDVSPESLGEPILTAINVDDIATGIINDRLYNTQPDKPYEEKIVEWAHSCTAGTKINSPVGAHCFNCEFKSDNPNMKSGFHECWMSKKGLSLQQLKQPMIGEIWNFHGKKKLLEEEGILFIKDVLKEHISKSEIKPNADGSLSPAERRWMQVEKVQNNDNTVYFDYEGMHQKMRTFTYPLHFIDFETSTVAIPFYQGQNPYEMVAFQFSHHILYKDGTLTHANQYIESEPGVFPNFNFVRELKKALENDNGTIFRYAAHENTVLNQIKAQLQTSDESDKDELIEFINTITFNRDEEHVGERNMVDMLEMVKDYYYDPYTKGSNSIKAVLPAVLKRSRFLQELYSQPIYGKGNQMDSHNFESGWKWIEFDKQGNPIDPYKLLPPLFEGMDKTELLSNDDSISSGGAALTAFAKMQFTTMSPEERKAIVNGLLKYCELDTLAMVMIYQHWQNEISENI